MIDSITYKNIGGIKCCIINKPRFLEKQAMIAFKYGSINNQFFVNNKEINHPFGIAHFLEHKMFEQEDYTVFEEFNKLGASGNAFTNFTTTAYYFSCTENFNENLKILLDFVSKPYFTKENVEKEKGIIAQEIKMYEDDPYWKCYFNLLSAIFGKDTPLSKDIAGDVEDISKIDKDMLYSCYENFYTKDNAIIICCGDFQNYDEIYDTILKNLKINENKKGILKEFNINCNVAENYVEKKMETEQIIFNIGFKNDENSGNIYKDTVLSKIMLDIVFGKSSSFYQNAYNKKLIDNSFNFSLNFIDKASFYLFSGSSNKPKEVLNYLIENIKKFKISGIKQEDFLRIKNKYLGSFIMQFNSISSIVSMEADFFTKDFSLLDYYSAYENITLEDINLILNKFNLNNYSLSIVN